MPGGVWLSGEFQLKRGHGYADYLLYVDGQGRGHRSLRVWKSGRVFNRKYCSLVASSDDRASSHG